MYQHHPTWRRAAVTSQKFVNKYLYPEEPFNFRIFHSGCPYTRLYVTMLISLIPENNRQMLIWFERCQSFQKRPPFHWRYLKFCCMYIFMNAPHLNHIDDQRTPRVKAASLYSFLKDLVNHVEYSDFPYQVLTPYHEAPFLQLSVFYLTNTGYSISLVNCVNDL